MLLNDNESDYVLVEAAIEDLHRVTAKSFLDLLKAAYHLGNRHIDLELHEKELFFLKDSVLEQMLKERGLIVESCKRQFFPEGGAYQLAHSHNH